MADDTTTWGRLQFSDGTAYALTAEDMLWTARAAVYEGGDPALTLWTLAQRFSQLRNSFPTFTEFVRGFSQPVNPRWLRDGLFCKPRGHYVNTEYCSEARLARRDRAVASDWYDLNAAEPNVTATVIAWGQGLVGNPLPRSTNFADPHVAAAYVAEHPGTKVLRVDGNWYLQDAWAATWSKNRVRIIGADGAIASADGVQRGTGAPAPQRGPIVAALDLVFRTAMRPTAAWRL